MPAHTTTFICRNIIYTCIIPEQQLYKQPRALNWRYQVPGRIYNQPIDPELKYVRPRALNWRWQFAGTGHSSLS